MSFSATRQENVSPKRLSGDISNNCPPDCEKALGRGIPGQPPLQRVDQPVARLQDLVFDIEDLLVLLALPLIQFPDLLLNGMLRVGKTGMPEIAALNRPETA
jgi:hypothetical protein